ncbi:MAG: flagellar hook-basal body complex protein [Candidatus Riflebacteria bacterium]|nr:flagellar hook-basal body complex protein [Candidatus Riflebacteria bacterium]
MIRSLFTGVSGLKQEQTKMDVLSNNVANVNTTAFKKGRAMFEDLFCQTLKHAQQAFGTYGGTNAEQVGLGVKLGSIDTLMEQGTLQSTGKNTDVAIEGDGFFVVNNGTGAKGYTRDGNMSVNPNYDLVMNSTGYKIQGWLSTQNPVTGNLEMKDGGLVPGDINVTKYLKKFAHQTNNITYASNLNSSSDERDIKMGLNQLAFQDSTGNNQSLTLKFKKYDAQHWSWTANDDTEGMVAQGTITADANGKITNTTCVDKNGNQSYPTGDIPSFTYDPDGLPAPASATALINGPSNLGNGTTMNISASGPLVKDEKVQVIFDGGDPEQATTYRVVGDQRGFIGSGTLGGDQASIEGTALTFQSPSNWSNSGTWSPTTPLSFNVTYTNPNVTGTPVVPMQTQITIPAIVPPNAPYTPQSVSSVINDQLKNAGIPALSSFDAITKKFRIVANESGNNRSLQIDPLPVPVGDLADLGLASSAGIPKLGTGASKPQIIGTPLTNAAAPAVWSNTVPSTMTVPAGGLNINIMPSEFSSPTVITFTPGQSYTKEDIVTTINTQLAATNQNNNVTCTIDPLSQRLLITGLRSGSGESVSISSSTGNLDLIGLPTGLGPFVYGGTAGMSTFSQGGINFTLTEGTKDWRPNESLTMSTTAEKGMADSVKVTVPNALDGLLAFKTSVNTPLGPKDFSDTGAINMGATHSTSITIYDSLGASHNLVTSWEHTDTASKQWSMKITYDPKDSEITNWMKDPANGVVDPSAPTDQEYARANDALITNRKGTIYFFDNGKIDQAKSSIPIPEMTPNGSNKVKVSLDPALITEFSSDFTTAARDQDGYEMGLLNSVYFEQDGTIRGVYSNGQKQPIGQLALATFNNPSGLEKQGSNLYDVSPNSGSAVVGKPASGARGTIAPGSLEMSNVDIAEEFTSLIITQRAFQACSKIITTSDEMLQDVVNLKR